LLAFKAYQGGDYGPNEFAGALFIVDAIEAVKGTHRLLESLLKALARKKR
jgi:hypothetical protein